MSNIFVNRTLNMNGIKLVGFDMDYTLVTYNVPVFEAKAYELVKARLVAEHGWDPAIMQFDFDPDFIIRGLVIDTESGDLLKVDRFGFVRQAAHGTRMYSFEDMRQRFGSEGIDFSDPRYYIVHTLFSIGEGCLFAQLVDVLDDHRQPHPAVQNLSNHDPGQPDYRQVFRLIRSLTDEIHQNDEIKGDVLQNPQRYIQQQPAIVQAVQELRRCGKRTALITNSDYEYSKQVMDYCFNPFLDGQSWHELFDLIVVLAAKPGYFQGQSKYLKVDPASGCLTNFFGPIEWGGIYQGGNARSLEKDLGLNSGEILYLGDHILGDVITLKEATGWRTGLVIQELDEEVATLRGKQQIHRQIEDLMQQKEGLESQLAELKQAHWQPADFCLSSKPADKKKRDELRSQIAKLDEKLSQLIMESRLGFNPCWGEIMRAGNEISRFAMLVERYACIYMAGIANLQQYSPFHFFRSRRRLMAHDPQG